MVIKRLSFRYNIIYLSFSSKVITTIVLIRFYLTYLWVEIVFDWIRAWIAITHTLFTKHHITELFQMVLKLLKLWGFVQHHKAKKYICPFVIKIFYILRLYIWRALPNKHVWEVNESFMNEFWLGTLFTGGIWSRVYCLLLF